MAKLCEQGFLDLKSFNSVRLPGILLAKPSKAIHRIDFL